MYTVSNEIKILSPARNVFDALTNQKLLSQWFAPQVIAVPVEETIAAFAFEFDLNFKMKIVSLKRNELLQWLCVDGYIDWLDSEITFRLEPESDGTKVIFKHSKLPNEDKKEKTILSWNGYLQKLKKLCEQESI